MAERAGCLGGAGGERYQRAPPVFLQEFGLLALPLAVRVVCLGGAEGSGGGVGRKASARGGETCEAKSIVDHCVDANLARFKVPKRIVFVDSISLNAMGKVSRSALLETYARELETPTL